MADVNVHPLLLQDQGRRFTHQAKALADAMTEAVPLLEQLREKGLGWDFGGRNFAVPYTIQEEKVMETLANIATVLVEVKNGLDILAKRLPDADRETAERFRGLKKMLETGPQISVITPGKAKP